MNSYNKFASIYDKLMQDVDYDRWTQEIVKIIKREKANAKFGLDLACGSGNFSTRLAKSGFSIMGADISMEMLIAAREKRESEGIEYILQDLNSLNVHRHYDFITILCDGINYSLEGADFSKIADALSDDGVLIFDISTIQRLSKELGNNLFFFENEEIAYACSNSYNKKKALLQMDLTFFVRKGKSELFERFCETHLLKAYTVEELEERLSPYFSTTTIDLCLPHDKKGSRLHFVCKKRHENY